MIARIFPFTKTKDVESMYIDNRNPIPTNSNVSKVMKANKGKNTVPEKVIRNLLREIGQPGYRLNWKKAPGRPDIAYPSRKIAIFINGCFWHRCPKCNLPLPKTHTDFWKNKFENNVRRDIKKIEELETLGWSVKTIWECEIKKNKDKVKNELINLFN